IYVYAQYHRLPNDMKQTIKNPQTQQVELGQTYKMMTFNIGYGSYPPSFNFFMEGQHEPFEVHLLVGCDLLANQFLEYFQSLASLY
ncbi:hypothetical protein PS009_23650, partial [Shigella sonnei]|nr:hypothetical protein [Shigella sonnei]